MRVAYLVGWQGGISSGPFKKIVAQTETWAREGVDVGLFVLTSPEHRDDWAQVENVKEITVRSPGLRLAVQKERLLQNLFRWRPDVTYHRWALPYPGLVVAVRRAPVVFEINTDDVAEYDALSARKGRVNRLTRGMVLRRAAGLVFVTRELQSSQAFAPYGRVGVVIANGVRLSELPFYPAPRNEHPQLVFLGQPGCSWHGIDKVLWLARRRPQWGFDVVGPSTAELPQAPTPNVTVHGLLPADRYRRLLAGADVAIGTLALHRKSMNEASSLKVREYLAAGLPVVLGHSDTDFPDGADFLLPVSNTEDNVEAALPQIDGFVAAWQGRRVPRELVAHLDEAAKERQRLAFLAAVAGLRLEVRA